VILPTVLTGSITAKTNITATAGGNVTDSGSRAITERGICFSTTINPTIANTKTASGTNVIGAFTVSLTGLSALTTFHYRAYVTTSLGTSYGADSVFTTNGATVPTLTTTVASSITTNTATSGGNITSDGGTSITARGVCWSTTVNPTIALATKTVDGTGTGAFTSSITGLTLNTTYYVRAYATNSAGTAYGTQQTFTTLTNIPTVTTNAISSITTTTATSGGNITSDGGATITARGICWSTTANPTIALTTKTVDGTGIGAFTSSITGLAANTRYYVRAYATNSVGTAYGADSVFTTSGATVATLTTTAASIITGTTATCGGNITSDGGVTITARGICWSTSANPTIALATKTVDGTGTGVFTSSITGLTANTLYYVRAYATNSVGAAYGTQQTFTTSSAVANLPSVTIGSQVWTTQNLSVARYRNGDLIPQVTNPNQWGTLTYGAWCWYNNDSATYAATYGRLYNWYAVNDARGLAPQGWHIPSNTEWNRLAKYLDAVADTICQTCYESVIAGSAMKSITGWSAPNTGATNSSGFAGLPGGLCNFFDGTFINVGYNGGWWSSTEFNTSDAWYRVLNYNNNFVSRITNPKLLGLSVRCVKDTTPILTTTTPTNLTTTTATSGGNITSDGGATITARGICWSTTANPTIALATKTVDGTGAGTFNSSITGLTANTTYYVRAYATNSAGTAYGVQQTFTTSSGSTTILPNVGIGSQVWTTQNLSVVRYRNGDIIPQITDPTQWAALTTGAWCWYNNDSATYAATYGRLYNWYAVNDARGLAPQGYHIPSDAEWNKLVKYLDAGADTTCSGCTQSTIGGGAMKSTTGWNAPNTGATNSTGFAGLPGGCRGISGSFFNIGANGYWWSSTEKDTTYAWSRFLLYNSSVVYRNYNTKSLGYSVRCVRD
jgi:uncharacterized protein (TIGR02145 family)